MLSRRLGLKIDKLEELVETKIAELGGLSFCEAYCFINPKDTINLWSIELLHKHLEYGKVVQTVTLEFDPYKSSMKEVADMVVLSLIFNND